MKYRLDKGCHSVYCLQFHLVICIKYRHKILTGDIEHRLKEIIKNIATKSDVKIIEMETNLDHIHILFSSKPTVILSRFVNSIKSVSSKIIRKEFSDIIKRYLWNGKLWSDSYFIASTGQVTLEDIKHYVQTQKER
jgi:putative transposase